LESKLHIDGRLYEVQVIRKVSLAPDAPRLIVVSRQPNQISTNLVQVCVETIQHLTPEPHELWVVDNNSPMENLDWLLQWPSINLALNRTEPRPPNARTSENVGDPDGQLIWGSYANAIALETAVRLISPQSRYIVTLHMDTMPCRRGWLSYLRSKITDKVRAAGVRMDRPGTPEEVLHVLGYLLDFQLFKRFQLDFLPDLPALDVGDKVTRMLRQEGYDVFACPNTLWEPGLASQIPADSPLREFSVDRAFDDHGRVIFLHLGRGVRKSIGIHKHGTMADEWIRLAREHLLL
jgi:hypothetical protein